MIEKLKRGVKFFTFCVMYFIGLIILYLICGLVAIKIILPIIKKMGA